MSKIFILIAAVVLFVFPMGSFAADSQDSDLNATSTISLPENGTTANSTGSLVAVNASVPAVVTEAGSVNSTESIIPADYKEVGFASWYGEKFHGKLTASGEPYDMDELTAAHNYLPLGVKVRVTNISNKKSVVVTINDRGPFVPDRVIDLSRAAGEKIGILDHGKAKVIIEAYRPEIKAEASSANGTIVPAAHSKELYGAFYVQVGAFKVKKNVDLLLEQIKDAGFSKYRIMRIVTDDSEVFKVQVGMFKSLAKARSALGKLNKKFPGAFVTADVIQE